MRHIIFRLLATLVLIAAVAGIGVLAYNAGMAHQTAVSAQAPTTQNGSPSYPVYGVPMWPFPFLGLGFFGLLAVFFLFFVAFGALRFVLWGPRFGWHHRWRRYGPWGEREAGEHFPIPPMMAEMHRRMHAADSEKPADQTTQKED